MRLFPLLLLLMTACAGGTPNERPTVVTAIYPLQWLTEQVVGDSAKVVSLVKPGVEPHDVELTPRQVATIRDARVVFYLKGFQPAVDDAVEGLNNAFDLSKSVTLVRRDGALDPHVWLDPVLMKAMLGELTSVLGDTVAWMGEGYGPASFDSAHVGASLDALDRDVRAQLEGCRTREIVTSHAAFGYFAQRYGLTQRGISGLSPEAEPSPKRLAEVAAFAKANGVTTIFFESLVSPKVAETVAAEVGARTAVLDPLESVTGTDDYLSVMRRNAATLHDALGCR